MAIRFTSRERASKQADSFKRQHELWRQAYAHAEALGVVHPNVEELLFDLTFVDPVNLGTYSPRRYSFYPSAKAFFGIACPRTLCLQGGFHLEEIVTRLLGSGKKRASGQLDCAGHLEPVDSEPRPCGLHMIYRIEVRYAGKT